jgi:hypothetical protein
MIEITGDFWDVAEWQKYFNQSTGLVCTTNNTLTNDGKLVMGAGIAKDFKTLFPGLDERWGKILRNILNRYEYPNKAANHINPVLIDLGAPKGNIMPIWRLFAFPTKYHWKNPSDLRLIEHSAQQLTNLVDIMGLKHVLMTRPGCGNGGLSWDVVKPKIDYLDDRFVVINNG